MTKKMQSHIYNIRVYYEDTDAGGVVYYANYLRFAERARTEMLREAGFEHAKLLISKKIAFAVRNCNISYRRSAKLDDKLKIKSKVIKITGSRMEIEQLIYNDIEELITEINVTLVCINVKTGKALRLPKECREIFSKMI